MPGLSLEFLCFSDHDAEKSKVCIGINDSDDAKTIPMAALKMCRPYNIVLELVQSEQLQTDVHEEH